jgi:hypothetical protein
VADGVWVRQSAWVLSNAIVVRGADGLILVDLGIDGSDLDQLADDLDGLAGDMLSDVLIPLLDPRRPGQVGAYETALGRLGEAARHEPELERWLAGDVPVAGSAAAQPHDS